MWNHGFPRQKNRGVWEHKKWAPAPLAVSSNLNKRQVHIFNKLWFNNNS